MTARPLAAITGGTGFVGLHLVPTLARAGFRLRLLIRQPLSYQAFAGHDVETVVGSLQDKAALAELVHDADVVIHAAGLIKAHKRADFLKTNRDGTEALAHITRQQAPKARFLLVSSLAAREPSLSPYSFSKQAAEQAVQKAYALAPAQLAIIRPPALYGPWDKETLPLFQASQRRFVPLLSKGKAALLHVDDAAEALTALAGAKFRPGCFTLADERPAGYDMREIFTAANKAVGGRTPCFFNLPAPLLLAAGLASGLWGQTHRVAPIFTLGKAREILHLDWSVSALDLLPADIYTPRISLAEGFAQTVNWYRQAGWLHS